MKFLSSVESEVLISLFSNWALATSLGQDLVQAKVLSARKRWCALWQALTPPLTLKEVARETETGVSDQTLAQWRRDPVFRSLADAAAREFANHLGREVTAAAFGDKIRRLVLTSLWVRLPGFNVADIVEAINTSANDLERNPIKRNIMRLYNLLVAFRDMLRLAQEQLKPTKWREIESKAHDDIAPILEIFESKVKEAKQKELLDDTLSAVLLNTVTSIKFLCAYSKIVI